MENATIPKKYPDFIPALRVKIYWATLRIIPIHLVSMAVHLGVRIVNAKGQRRDGAIDANLIDEIQKLQEMMNTSQTPATVLKQQASRVYILLDAYTGSSRRRKP